MLNSKIGYFPLPYPDELLNSLIARYIYHTGHPSQIAITELFGRPFSICFHLPHSLDKLIERISSVIRVEIDDLIEKHTLFGFLTSFGSISRKEKMYRYIAFGEGNFSNYKIDGLELGKLKYCVLCAQEDIGNYGETYWHRSHNLPSVNACYKHNCQLETFNTKISNFYSTTFFLADKIIDLNCPIKSTTKDQIFIAKSFYEILLSKSRIMDNIYFTSNSYKLFVKSNGRDLYIKRFDFKKYIITNFPDFKFLVQNEKLASRKISNILGKTRVGTHPILTFLIYLFLESNIKSLNVNFKCMIKTCKNYFTSIDEICSVKIYNKERKSIIRYLCVCPNCKSEFWYYPNSNTYICISISNGFIDTLKRRRNKGESIRSLWQDTGLGRDSLKKILVDGTIKNMQKKIDKKIYNKRRILRMNEWKDLVSSGHFKTLAEIPKTYNKLRLWLYKNNNNWIKEQNRKYLSANRKITVSPNIYKKRDHKLLKQLKEFYIFLKKKNGNLKINKGLFYLNVKGLTTRATNHERYPLTSSYFNKILKKEGIP
ncbi:MAG: TniQ family protein [Cyclobacteriaceae bacterium]|nr:TniQ family protein [Cyclobacteriaceae bacterium]